jgi:hypothetical protein
MNIDTLYFSIPAALAGGVALVSLAWHIAVIVFVYKTWQKVKHLPG